MIDRQVKQVYSMVEIQLAIYIVLLTLSIFAIDIAFPLGVAAYIPYIIIVTLFSWMPRSGD
jgi:hypothetical protein